MISRRNFVGLIPVTALSLPAGSWAFETLGQQDADKPLISSPPVVQHPMPESFSVSVAVSGFATGWVEWGFSADQLDRVAIAHSHGLIRASDRALLVRVGPIELPSADSPIYYRFVVQPLAYKNAYQLQRGESQATPVFQLRLPRSDAQEITVAIVNDTHENSETLKALHQRIEELKPDVLVWNGDTCNDFDLQDDPMQIVLNPGGDVSRGWASERPLLFVPGNHDVRGMKARQLSEGLGAWPGQSDLPYNFALRFGPLALVGLDTGEDKPDAHPVFAGTAAYEPYRESQATWLKTAVKRAEIADAKLRVAVCHIPLRGQGDDNDGMSLEGYAGFCGFGSKLWMPILREAGFRAVISGHTHRFRIDEATESEPVMQVVGGAPRPDRATLTILRATADGTELKVENLSQQPLYQLTL